MSKTRREILGSIFEYVLITLVADIRGRPYDTSME